jgi:flagellar biosynthesis repressor protein FlbT
MALKITLKPHERMILGGAAIINGHNRSDFIVENNAPILRQKDIMSEQDAHSPCRRIYLVIQLMYVDDKNLTTYHNLYWKLVRSLVKAAPSMTNVIDQISEHLLNNRYYQALKLARRLIQYEEEAIQHVQKGTGSLQSHRQGNDVRP